MDFFEQQDQSRKATRRLTGLYLLAVAGTCLTLHAGLAFCLTLTNSADAGGLGNRFLHLLLNPQFASLSLGLTCAIILFSSLYKIAQLRAGGAGVAQAMGGREVLPTTQEVLDRRLLNVVEEMALASGIAMPRVFVLDDESGMNAFAAGYSSKDAAVAVTRGLLNGVRREELQAVIGHEFSHILNGDMRMNIRLVGVLHGIFALAILGTFLLRLAASRPRGKNGKQSIAILLVVGVVCWVVGQVGFFFGRWIQSGISRQREYLADASAVQFTRNPLGLASALKVIGAVGSRLQSPGTSEVSHMLFASGLTSIFATHPPLLERIRRLDPQFDGDFSKVAFRQEDPVSASCVTSQEELYVDAFDRDALHDPVEAIGCICGSLLAEEAAVQERQMEMLPVRNDEDTVIRQGCQSWGNRLRALSIRQRRKTCELAVATLQHEPRALRERLAASVQALSHADGVLSPFEFALGCMIRRRLLPEETIILARQAEIPPGKVAEEIAYVLWMVAVYGARTDEAMQAAWRQGMARVTPFIGHVQVDPGIKTLEAARMDAALRKLERLAPIVKREFMQACEESVRFDGTITEAEETFLFAIADAIDAIGWNNRGHD